MRLITPSGWECVGTFRVVMREARQAAGLPANAPILIHRPFADSGVLKELGKVSGLAVWSEQVADGKKEAVYIGHIDGTLDEFPKSMRDKL